MAHINLLNSEIRSLRKALNYAFDIPVTNRLMGNHGNVTQLTLNFFYGTGNINLATIKLLDEMKIFLIHGNSALLFAAVSRIFELFK